VITGEASPPNEPTEADSDHEPSPTAPSL